MKYKLCILLSIVIMATCLVFCACHTHEYGEWEVTSYPTCVQEGEKQRVCQCGNKEVEPVHKDVYAHVFDGDEVCKLCNFNLAENCVAKMDISAGANSTVNAFVISREDGLCNLYVVGNGATKDFVASQSLGKTDFDIEKIYIGNGVTNIGKSVFHSCHTVVEVVMSNSITSIGQGAFYNCESLERIRLSTSLESIGTSVFGACSNLKSIDIPQGVKELGNLAFNQCTSLESLFIPSSVTTIGRGVVSVCLSLTNITVAPDNPSYKSVDGNLYSKDGKVLLQYAIGKTADSFVIPDGVTTVGAYAFARCDYLTQITLPKGIIIVDDYSFSLCKNLAQIDFPQSLEKIAHGSFMGCESLTSVTIPVNVKQIDNIAFNLCKNLVSATFVNPTGWYVTKTQGASSGEEVSLGSPEENANYLRGKYSLHYWYCN